MKIVVGKPPVWDRADKAFDLTGDEIFAWGNTIYNPSGNWLPPWLIEHEKVHRAQQGEDVEGWWDVYLTDPQFRLEQEMEAHQVEYKAYCKRFKSRDQRVLYLDMIAGRLASPMYGNVISKQEAVMRIRGK